jgi:hypothetical protein
LFGIFKKEVKKIYVDVEILDPSAEASNGGRISFVKESKVHRVMLIKYSSIPI